MKPVFSPTFLGLRLFLSVLVISLLPFPFANATAQNSLSSNQLLDDAPVEKATPENVFPTRFGDLKYGKKGIEFSSNRNETELWVGVRLQTRLDTYKGNLASVEDLLRESDAGVLRIV